LLSVAAVVVVAPTAAAIGTVVGDQPQPAPTQARYYDGPADHTSAPAPTKTQIDSPGGRAMEMLNRGTAALLAGDEAGWLAIVDPDKPKLRAYYRNLYRALRGLGVTQLEYHRLIPKPVGWEDTSWDEDFYLTYCFSMNSCPTFKDLEPSGPDAPMITQ